MNGDSKSSSTSDNDDGMKTEATTKPEGAKADVDSIAKSSEQDGNGHGEPSPSTASPNQSNKGDNNGKEENGVEVKEQGDVSSSKDQSGSRENDASGKHVNEGEENADDGKKKEILDKKKASSEEQNEKKDIKKKEDGNDGTTKKKEVESDPQEKQNGDEKKVTDDNSPEKGGATTAATTTAAAAGEGEGVNNTATEKQVSSSFPSVVVNPAVTNKINTISTPQEQDDDAALEALDLSQSERKRFREKKRRKNITAAIEQLTKVIVKADSENFMAHNNQVYYTNDGASKDDALVTSHLLESTNKKPRTDSMQSTSHHQPLNRTEIINHAAILIEKLAKRREEYKMELLTMQHQHAMIAAQQQQQQGENGAGVAAAGVATTASPAPTNGENHGENGAPRKTGNVEASQAPFASQQASSPSTRTGAPSQVMMTVPAAANGLPTQQAHEQQPGTTYYVPATYPFPQQQYIMNGTNLHHQPQGGVFQWPMHPQQQTAYVTTAPKQVGSVTPMPFVQSTGATTTNAGTTPMQYPTNGVMMIGGVGAPPSAGGFMVAPVGDHQGAQTGTQGDMTSNNVMMMNMNHMTSAPPPHGFDVSSNVPQPGQHQQQQHQQQHAGGASSSGAADTSSTSVTPQDNSGAPGGNTTTV